jgi:glycerophosphoryl diester phosphodiesterase
VNIEPKSDSVLAPLADLLHRHDASRASASAASIPAHATGCALLGGNCAWSPAHGGVLRLWVSGWGFRRPFRRSRWCRCRRSFHGIPVVTRRFVEAAHARGIQVHVWTVDEEAEMERLLDMGVDALMTDRPSLLRAVLERRGQWHGR